MIGGRISISQLGHFTVVTAAHLPQTVICKYTQSRKETTKSKPPPEKKGQYLKKEAKSRGKRKGRKKKRGRRESE